MTSSRLSNISMACVLCTLPSSPHAAPCICSIKLVLHAVIRTVPRPSVKSSQISSPTCCIGHRIGPVAHTAPPSHISIKPKTVPTTPSPVTQPGRRGLDQRLLVHPGPYRPGLRWLQSEPLAETAFCLQMILWPLHFLSNFTPSAISSGSLLQGTQRSDPLFTEAEPSHRSLRSLTDKSQS